MNFWGSKFPFIICSRGWEKQAPIGGVSFYTTIQKIRSSWQTWAFRELLFEKKACQQKLFTNCFLSYWIHGYSHSNGVYGWHVCLRLAMAAFCQQFHVGQVLSTAFCPAKNTAGLSCTCKALGETTKSIPLVHRLWFNDFNASFYILRL